ncbi:MAG: hypothetical protein JWR01_696, partial [Subtercola sp.]|nr:hypothetical protein [Subtercola sp.]
TAAAAIGALCSSILSGRLGHVRWQGRAVGSAITVYGLFIAGFGLVLLVSSGSGLHGITESITDANLPALAIAAVMLAGSGAADNVSSIFRNTILQAAVPDGMRGRIQGVFMVVVTGGPRLGDAYIGILSAFAFLWLPPLMGGVFIVVLVLAIVRGNKRFRHYDALAPTP